MKPSHYILTSLLGIWLPQTILTTEKRYFLKGEKLFIRTLCTSIAQGEPELHHTDIERFSRALTSPAIEPLLTKHILKNPLSLQELHTLNHFIQQHSSSDYHLERIRGIIDILLFMVQ